MREIPESDIAMFARGFMGRHGVSSEFLARERARDLSALGDRDGVDAWLRVAQSINDLMKGRRKGETARK